MIKPKKSLGQNFLIDKNICKKIVKLTNINKKEIIEIGPGKGILTDFLILNKPKKIFLIEKDNKLCEFLKKKYQNNNIVKIINIDALKFNYELIPNAKIIISNLPYNISIKLIINWLKLYNHFNELILMIQKEVAIKMNYKNNVKKNRLNLFIESTSNYEIMFHVSKNVFFPKPKVNSSVIKIIPKKNIKLNIELFEKFTKEIFNFKRKKLSNTLKIDKKFKNEISKSLLEKRAEDLKTSELHNLFNKYYIYQ